MRKIIKIFIADDHPIFRRGLVDILKEEKDFEIGGRSSGWGCCVAEDSGFKAGNCNP